MGLYLVISCLLVSLLGCAGVQDAAEHPKPPLRNLTIVEAQDTEILPTPPLYEYEIVIAPFVFGPDVLQSLLASSAREHWRVVGVCLMPISGGGILMVFERERQQQ